MKKLLVYMLALMLALPIVGSESTAAVKSNSETKVEASKGSFFGKKKNKKKKRKHTYRPGARQN